MPEEFSVEPQHSLVLVPLHKNGTGSTAYPFMVHNRGIGHEKNLPSFLPKTHAPIKILAVKEVTFIPQADIFDCFPPRQHESPGNSLHLNRMIRQRLLVKMKIKKQTRPITCKAIEPKSANK